MRDAARVPETQVFDLKAEFNTRQTALANAWRAVGVARSARPDSASCQFFIMHKDSTHLDGQYSAFGKVKSGIEAVDKIVSVHRRGRGIGRRIRRKSLKSRSNEYIVASVWRGGSACAPIAAHCQCGGSKGVAVSRFGSRHWGTWPTTMHF